MRAFFRVQSGSHLGAIKSLKSLVRGILSQLKDREKLEEIIQNDPYYLNDVADFEIIEFNPVKHHPHFIEFVK